MKKRIVLTVACLAVMCLLCLDVFSTDAHAAVVQEGSCGSAVTWVLDDAGVLTISGTGPMTNYTSSDNPWRTIRKQVTSIIICDGVTSIGTCAFTHLVNVTQVSIADSVVSIGSNAFTNCESLKAIKIPHGVTKISDHTFDQCMALTEISLPNTVSTIGEFAFSTCTALTTIELPDSVTSIASYAFASCCRLTSIAIPNGVKKLSRYTFRGCEALERVTIPDSVTVFEESVFEGCSALDNVVLPKQIEYIPFGMFRFCSSLRKVDVPSGVTEIGGSAFTGCTSLRTVTLPNTLTAIYSQAFEDCTSLSSIQLPQSLTELGNSAFWGCTSLKQITIPNGVSEISASLFRDCTALTQVSLPARIAEINAYAFAGCAALTEIVIPYSTTRIGNHAFEGCSDLRCVVLPAGLKEIWSYAFNGCDNLWHVLCKGSQGQWNEMKRESYNLALSNATIHYLCRGDEVTDSKNGVCTICLLACKHQWDNGVIKETATCAKEGTLQYTCKLCDETKEEPIAKLAHDFEIFVVRPTCQRGGHTTYACKNCDYKEYKDSKPPTGHTPVTDPTVEPTCTENGLQGGERCSVCQIFLEYREVLKATGHKDANGDLLCDRCDANLCTEHIPQIIPSTPATCQKTGLSEGSRCARCGQILAQQQEIELQPHNFDIWVQVKAPTEQEEGLSERGCIDCGTVEQQRLPVLQVQPTEPTEPAQPDAQPATQPVTQPTAPEDTIQLVPAEPSDRAWAGVGVVIVLLTVTGGIFIVKWLTRKRS